MRLPEFEKDGKWVIDEDKAIQVIHKAFELGVNYIDTAYPYCHGNSEYTVGKALKDRRDKVYLATKMPTWLVKEKGDYRRLLEEQLGKLNTEYIDFYFFHDLNKDRWQNIASRFKLLDDAMKAKQEGLIKHIAFSVHDKPEFIRELLGTGMFEAILCQYNLLDRTNDDVLEYAREKGIGTVVMGPVGGGRLAAPSEVITGPVKDKYRSTPEIALRFVLANPNVDCALSGMNTIDMVEENARVASIEDPLSEDDWKRINGMLEETKQLADLYCTGCDYCMPCPQGIKISDVFRLMNYHRVYKLTQYAREEFQKLGKDDWHGKPPSECIECGACEPKCPQEIKIRERLKEVADEFQRDNHKG